MLEAIYWMLTTYISCVVCYSSIDSADIYQVSTCVYCALLLGTRAVEVRQTRFLFILLMGRSYWKQVTFKMILDSSKWYEGNNGELKNGEKLVGESQTWWLEKALSAGGRWLNMALWNRSCYHPISQGKYLPKVAQLSAQEIPLSWGFFHGGRREFWNQQEKKSLSHVKESQ